MDINQLDAEQEQQLILALHEQMVHSISFPEAIMIVSNSALEKIKKEVEGMSDEEKVQTYQDLDLK